MVHEDGANEGGGHSLLCVRINEDMAGGEVCCRYEGEESQRHQEESRLENDRQSEQGHEMRVGIERGRAGESSGTREKRQTKRPREPSPINLPLYTSVWLELAYFPEMTQV